jgi:phosphonopyruvate decarboxylase
MASDSVSGVASCFAPLSAAPPGERDAFEAPGSLPTRARVLESFLSMVDPAAAVVATTGKCGRELFTLCDRPQHLYQVGSMGCATSMALGLALNVSAPVVVLDGDGAALMKLGTMATVGCCRPEKFIHILLDNAVYDSTGGQPTPSPSVDFAAVAQACGYLYAASCRTLEGFEAAFRKAADGGRPAFIHARISPGSMAKLGRPTIPPHEVALRLREFVAPARRRKNLSPEMMFQKRLG